MLHCLRNPLQHSAAPLNFSASDILGVDTQVVHGGPEEGAHLYIKAPLAVLGKLPELPLAEECVPEAGPDLLD